MPRKKKLQSELDLTEFDPKHIQAVKSALVHGFEAYKRREEAEHQEMRRRLLQGPKKESEHKELKQRLMQLEGPKK